MRSREIVQGGTRLLCDPGGQAETSLQFVRIHSQWVVSNKNLQSSDLNAVPDLDKERS